MKKIISILCCAVLVLSLMSAAAFAEDATAADEAPAALSNWAYAGITLDSEDFGVGSVYYAADYFTRESILNPVTVEPYTEEELTAIIEGAVEGAEGYVVNVPADAVVGLSVYGMEGTIIWFDEENAAKVLASADPLVLNAEAYQVANLNGEAVAAALPALENWAYAGITLNSEDFGVSSVYYPAAYYTGVINGEIETVNPLTVAPYTSAEVMAIVSGAVESGAGYVTGAPENVAVGLGVYNSEDVVWFDTENAAGILSSADPLVLNAESGEVSNLAGEVVATAIAA